MLHIDHASKYFGGLKAIDDVTLTIQNQEIVGLIGANGSGKTTSFNLITGVLPLTKGKIYFQNKCLNKLKPYKICQLGIARTHQIPRPFKSLTVEENIKLACFYGNKKGNANNKKLSNKTIHDWLSLVGLNKSASNLAHTLNDVQAKMLELVRSLATSPKLLLLDEILAGLNPSEVKRFQEVILWLRDEIGITIFWVEHNMNAIMTICDRVICMDHGNKIFSGKPKEAVANKKVIASFLGET